jgi:hypothetical protein
MFGEHAMTVSRAPSAAPHARGGGDEVGSAHPTPPAAALAADKIDSG